MTRREWLLLLAAVGYPLLWIVCAVVVIDAVTDPGPPAPPAVDPFDPSNAVPYQEEP